MIQFQTQRVVGSEHIDAGNHANWRAQLSIAESVHFELRNKHGFDLEQLRAHGLFLVISSVKKVDYFRPLKLGDVIDTDVMLYVCSKCCINVEIRFYREKEPVTRFIWVMAMTSDATGKPRRIPNWLIDTIC